MLQTWLLEMDAAIRGKAVGHHQTCIPLAQPWKRTLALEAAEHSPHPHCQSHTLFHPRRAAVVSRMQGSHTDAVLGKRSGKHKTLGSSVAPLPHH